MMDYATLTQIRAYLKLEATETGDDTLLQTFITWANQQLDAKRRGDVRLETRYYDYPIKAASQMGVYDVETWVQQMNAAGLLSQGRLLLDDDLLALISVTNGDGNALPTTELVLEPANLYPKHILRTKRGSSYSWLMGTNGEREQVIAVTGWWGYHPDYGGAWINTDAVGNDPLAANGTSITVAASSRFQVGQMLKIESEFVLVTALASGTSLTVTRGVNGTTAAAHVKNTVIYRYNAYGNYALAATRLVAWRYRQKDANVFEKTTSFETGTTIIPAALPEDIKALMPPDRMIEL
jgi:hypothetical protein